MKVHVKMFAAARQFARSENVAVELPENATVAELRTVLAKRFPDMAELIPRMQIAVDAEYAADSQRLQANQDVACIPPVSGG